MAKVEKTDQELEDDAKAANKAAPKDPADAARAKLEKAGTVADRQAEITKLQAEIDELQKPPRAEYPKMLYHPDQPAMTVNSAEQEKQLGSGWVESMDELPDVKARTKGSKGAKAADGPAKIAHDETAAGRGR